VREVLRGIHHWTVIHPRIGLEVSSYFIEPARVLLDPLVPAEGLAWFEGARRPRDALLTNRLHSRHSARFVERFGCEVWCNEEGLYQFEEGLTLEGRLKVRGFRPGDLLPGGIESHEVGVLCPDETALRIPIGDGVLAVADGVVRDGDGPLVFVPDPLLGEEPEEVKRGLKAAYRRLLALEFDHLLLAHGNPWIGGAKAALREFVGR
jgi:hypothetical protein